MWTAPAPQTIGLTQQDVAQSLLVALSGSFQTTPSFYLDPTNGVSYNVAIQAPQYSVDSLAALKSLPVTGHDRGATGRQRPAAADRRAGRCQRPVQVLGNLATITPGAELGTVSHYDVQPVIDIYANVDGTDLGTVTRAMEKIIARHEERSAARLALHPARPERDHEHVLHRPAGRPGVFHPAGLPADRGQLPVLARSVSHHFGAAGGAGRNRLVPLPHQHPAQRAGADRRHHVHGRGHGQLHPGGELCPRAVGGSGGRRAPAPR